MKFFLIFLFPTLLHAEDFCTINTYSKIMKLSSETNSPSDFIISSDCDERTDFKFNKFIYSVSGKINSKLIAREMGRSDVIIVPEEINVESLDSEIEARLSLPSQNRFISNTSIPGRSFIGLNESQSLTYECDNCSSLGDKAIKAIISDQESGKTIVNYVSSKVSAKILALKAVVDIANTQQALSPSFFSTIEIATTRPEDLLVDISKIQFFRLMRPIAKGTLLSPRDLVKMNLVNFGVPTKISFSNDSFSVTKTGSPLRAGGFGDIVEIKNPETKKTISAKVIDFNHVVVDL